MLKKRLIGVITVKDGWAVQSFCYRRYLPLGHPEVLAENLDRWGADEILVQCIARRDLGPDLTLLERVSAAGLSTPLIYSGGIRDVADGLAAVRAGADRICIDALLHDDVAMTAKLAGSLGAQAIIAALPLSHVEGDIRWFDYRTRNAQLFSSQLIDVLSSGSLSEALIIDHAHEGSPGSFDASLIEHLAVGLPLIPFGGISEPEQVSALLSHDKVAAVAIGNFLNYREHALQAYREAIDHPTLRPPIYDQPLAIA